MGKSLAAAVLLAAIVAIAQAHAFGTTSSQGSEHERISRHALACDYGNGPDCWQALTVAEFAGSRGDFGAIGIPDRGSLILQSKAHCDNGDHLDLPGYPRSALEGRQALENCRAWMQAKLDEAVMDAGGLLDAAGKLRADQQGLHCVFVGGFTGRAKCNVLEDLGIMMHASQDFYSHTNFTDTAAAGPTTVNNPPGLNQAGPSAWIALDGASAAFPAGLISGCFGGIPEAAFCKGHVRHADLNKDEGRIDPDIGAPETLRGKVGQNFQHAIAAAIADSRSKWRVFSARLTQTYGADKARRMICAIGHDEPSKSCA